MRQMNKELFKAFDAVRKILGFQAQGKGYTGLTPDAEADGRSVLDFVAQNAPGHPEGEIVYKVLRWRAKRDPQDLLKIMAWAFLLWDANNRLMSGQEAAPDVRKEEVAAPGYSDFPQRGDIPGPSEVGMSGVGMPERLLTKRDGQLFFQVIHTMLDTPDLYTARKRVEALKKDFESRG